MAIESGNQPTNVEPFAPRGQETTADLPTHVSRELAVLVDQQSTVAEALFGVTSQLQHMHVDAGIRSFCFIGDDRKVGTTVVAANVAAAFALSGLRTILVETNLQSPRLGEMFGLAANRPGLSDWISGVSESSSWSIYLQPVYQNLMVVTAGNSLREGEPFLSTELPHIITELSRMFDVVVCDAPPMANLSGTLAVVSAVERTIVVARANRSRLNAFIEFQTVVEKCRATIGGSVYLDF